MKPSPLLWVALFAGIAAIVAAIALTRPQTATPPDASRPVSESRGFGKLPNLGSGESVPLGAPGTRSAQPTFSSFVSSAPIADNVMYRANTGVTVSGGGTAPAMGIMIDPSVPETRPMPAPPYEEEYLPPRVEYVWEGTSLPSLPGEMEVFRVTPRNLSAAARTVVGALGMNAGIAGTVRSMNWTSGKDAAIGFSYDANSDSMNWYRETAWSEPARDAKSLSDENALRLANAFADTYGLPRQGLGAPRVIRFDDPCGRGMPCIMNATPPGVSGGSAGSAGAAEKMMVPEEPVSAVAPAAADMPVSTSANTMIYPWPGMDVTIQWDAALSGLPILDWSGQPSGALTMQVSSQFNQVSGGQLRLLSSLQRSRYPTQSMDAVLEAVKRGGSNPWGGYAETAGLSAAQERRRPTVRVTLTEARLGYTERYDYANNQAQQYFLPVVAFTGTVTDQYGNTSPYTIMVSALDPAEFAEPDQAPVPMPLMLRGQIEPAVAPPPMPVPEPMPTTR